MQSFAHTSENKTTLPVLHSSIIKRVFLVSINRHKSCMDWRKLSIVHSLCVFSTFSYSFQKVINQLDWNFILAFIMIMYGCICMIMCLTCIIKHGSCTVRKRRDPAILDREEFFLQLKIEEISLREVYCNRRQIVRRI